jgi:hypothetical protein
VADFQFRMSPATMGSKVAQGDSDSIGCRIAVDHVVTAARVSHEVNAFTVCRWKAA